MNATATTTRYFRSTVSDLFFKFDGEDAFIRAKGCQWTESNMTLAGMVAFAVEISEEEAEP